jgi:hypothetical protein
VLKLSFEKRSFLCVVVQIEVYHPPQKGTKVTKMSFDLDFTFVTFVPFCG